MKMRWMLRGCFAVCMVFGIVDRDTSAQSEPPAGSTFEVIQGVPLPEQVQEQVRAAERAALENARLAQTAVQEAAVQEAAAQEAAARAQAALAEATAASNDIHIVPGTAVQDLANAPAEGAEPGSDAIPKVYKIGLKARTGLQLQQQLQTLSATMNSLGRQLENLEKLEKSVRSEDLPTKAKLHAAAEAFALALREHVEAMKSGESALLGVLTPLTESQETGGDAQAADRYRMELSKIQLLEALANQKQTAALAEAKEQLQASLGQIDSEAALSAELAKSLTSKVLLERIAADVEHAKAVEDVVRSSAIAEAIKSKLRADEEVLKARAAELAQLKEEKLAPASEKMEQLESRLNRIEALLEKLTADKK